MVAIPHHLSPTEYLIIDRDSPTRHEYHHGLVYAMAGGSDAHFTPVNSPEGLKIHRLPKTR